MKQLAVLVLLAVSGVGSLFAAHLADQKVLTLEGAKAMAAAAEAEATKNNWNVIIVILGEGGHLLYMQRMDGAQMGSIDVAMSKAKSAYLFKRPTKVFEDGVASGRNALLGLPGAIAIEGGLPIQAGGAVIGSIGVSGVTSAQDAQIATAGLAGLQQ